MPIKQQTKEVNRSSVTGRFVTEQYANRHKSTTETQHVKVPTAPKRTK